MSEGEKFKNKYTIKSSRLEGYDYSQAGLYFITICIKDRKELFGKVMDGEMILNDMGKIVMKEWLQTAVLRPNIFLDEWVIMPNHLHGIIEIIQQLSGIETPLNKEMFVQETAQKKETPQRGVSTGGYNPRWKSNSLGSTINQFKSACTKKIWKSGVRTFAWQSRFYDHIIRNDDSLNKIRGYIQTNPERWQRDRNNPENIFM
jgi:putative transposase